MVRTIIITDNDDNTQSVRFFNVNNEGDNLIVNRGKVEYDISREKDCVGIIRAEINLKVKCLPDYEFTNPSSIENYSSIELIKELKSRNVLLEEMAYKVKI